MERVVYAVMNVYYVILSIYSDSETLTTMQSVYGYTDQLEVVLYFKRSLAFDNITVMECCAENEYEFINYFMTTYGVSVEECRDYRLEMRSNLDKTKTLPVYVISSDKDSVVSYVVDVSMGNFMSAMKKLPIMLKYMQNNSYVDGIWDISTLLHRYLQKYKKDGSPIVDEMSILINMIEEEGDYYYADS